MLDRSGATSLETSVRLAHRRRILSTVAHHYHDPGLGLGTIARRLGLSPRYVQTILAAHGETVSDLLRAKGRGRDMPVPVLVGSWNTIDGLVSSVDDRTRALVEAFWPGGLTLIVRHAPSLTWDLGDADGTVAIRMPLHPVAIELLEQTGPMAVSSANKSGRPPAQTAADAREQLGEDVAVYLEDGQVPGGVASTIVDVTGSRPRVVRTGAVSEQDLRGVVPDLVGRTP